MVFQSYALYPNMTVRAEHHLRHGDAAACRRPSATRRWRSVAELLQIEHLLDRKPASSPAASASASPWAARWCAIPLLFLFDEPLSNLDAKLRVDMRTEIKQLHQRIGDHHRLRHPRPDRGDDAGDAHRGDASGRGAAVRRRPTRSTTSPANLFVARFMGSPPMNTVPARLVGATMAGRWP